MEEVYLATNKNRKKFLDEIECLDLKLEGPPPVINKATKSIIAHHLDDWCVEIDFMFPGKFTILIKTRIKINWPSPNWHAIPVQAEVSGFKIKGKVRL